MSSPRHSKSKLPAARKSAVARWFFAVLVAFSGAFSLHAGKLTLTWQDNSHNEDGFEVERAVAGGSFGLLSTVGVDVQTFVDESVVPGREYEYRVRAFNAFGYSGYTNVSLGVAPNTAPEMGLIADVAIPKGETVRAVGFDFADAESTAGELSAEAISSNLSLVPLEGLSVTLDNDGTGTISISPSGVGTGVANVTVTLSDGVEAVQRVFKVEVLQNSAPTVSTLAAVSVLDDQAVGAIGFSIFDAESDGSELQLSAVSMDESLVRSDSIWFGGAGNKRTVGFRTLPEVTGNVTLVISVSDGVNRTNGALPVTISLNRAPTIGGMEPLYTILSGGQLTGLTFTIGDSETPLSGLTVGAKSSNMGIVSAGGFKLSGSGAQRTLDVTPVAGASGSVEIAVWVSDGVKTTTHEFTLRVLPPESTVKILSFSVVEGLAVIEVENQPNAAFTLWKIHGRNGAWVTVDGAEISTDAFSTIIVDPEPVESAVCYRVSMDASTGTVEDLLVDNEDGPLQVLVEGEWSASTFISGYLGSDYLHDGDSGKGSKSVTFIPTVGTDGSYEVFVRYTAGSARASNVPIDVVHAGGTTTVLVDQRVNGSTWFSVGVFDFFAGTDGRVVFGTAGTSGYVTADAVKLEAVAGD